MKRPVVLFLRLIGVAAAATLAVSACASSSTAPSHASAVTVAKQPVAQPPAAGNQAGDVVPVATTCDQNTRPAYKPDNSGFALLPGGGENMKVIYAKAQALAHNGTNGGFLFNYLPTVNIASAKSLASLKEGVMCPDGHIYINGDPHALFAGARVIDENSNGATARSSGSGTFSHKASEVLTAPCPAIIRDLGTLPNTKTVFFQAVCKDNGDLFDTNSITL